MIDFSIIFWGVLFLFRPLIPNGQENEGVRKTSRRKNSGCRFKSYEGMFPTDKHVRITKNMTDSIAFQSLSGGAIKLYIYMKMWACGQNSVTFAKTMAEKFMSPNAFFRARDELIAKGFIVFTNQMSAKYKRERSTFEFSDRWQVWRDSS